MRTVAVLSALLLSLTAGGAVAQIATSDTQTPPSPNSGAQAVESANSLPSSAITSSQIRAGSDVATTRVGPDGPSVAVPGAGPALGAPIR